MPGSLLAFFHPCLVSVLFSGPSLTEMKFYTNCFSLVTQKKIGCDLLELYQQGVGITNQIHIVIPTCVFNYITCIVTRGNLDHGVIRTIGHVVYYCVQWSELPRASRRTEEACSCFLHVYLFSKLVNRALHRIRCFGYKVSLVRKGVTEVKKDGSFPRGSLAPLCFVCHSCNVFQSLAFSY